jgi:D-amino-acid dehydrogenase
MSDSSEKPPVIVIGGGVVGICTASFLQRQGRRVTVIEAGDVGMGASYGNAGCLNGSSVVPVSMPGVLAKVPGWLLDPDGPLVLRWSYLPQIAPWLFRFVRAGREKKVLKQARALRPLLAPSIETYGTLVKAARCEHLVHRVGHLFVYRSDKSFHDDDGAMRLREDNGIAIDALDADELRQLEPTLSRDFVRARLIRENGHVESPLALVQALAEHFVRQGGTILRERVTGFASEGGLVTHVVTEQGRHAASHVVLAAGAWSKSLAAELGNQVPLDTERGYHVVIADPEAMPRIPCASGEGKFVATPMQDGLRIAGTVELAGLAAPPRWERARMMLRQAHSMFPALPKEIPESRVKMWMGFRPSMPDSLPVIGPSQRYGNAFHAFGHGHVGLAAGSMTGRTVAALVAGEAPPINIRPFRADRF